MDLSSEFHPVPKPLGKIKIPKSVIKAGRKTNEWYQIRLDLKSAFYKAGIINCELKFKNCWKNTALGFAHKAKRKKLTKEDLYDVVLACNPCHGEIEILPAEEMQKIINNVIKNRKVQPKLIERRKDENRS